MFPKQIIEKKGIIFDYVQSLGIDKNKIKDENLLLQSLIHKSFAADSRQIGKHNERLEFLGDGVLGSVICKLLFIDHPEMEESDMTLYKIALVREETLAIVAKNINLDKYIYISRGEEKMDGRKKDSILSDSLEALLGYIYIDLGYEHVEKFIKKYVYSLFDKVDRNPVKSYKTTAQEFVQSRYKQIPEYIDYEHKLDDKGNVVLYKSEMFVLGKSKSKGFGSNKKKAQEDAAKNFCLSLKKNK